MMVKYPPKLLEPIKKHLLEKQKMLIKRQKDLGAEDPFADPDRLIDSAAVDADAAEQFGHERVEAMQAEVDKSLVQVDQALKRIDKGKYGVCESCGKMVDTDRLAIDPAAKYCMACESKREKVER